MSKDENETYFDHMSPKAAHMLNQALESRNFSVQVVDRWTDTEITTEPTVEEIEEAYKIIKAKFPNQNMLWDESHRTDPVAHEMWKGMIRAILKSKDQEVTDDKKTDFEKALEAQLREFPLQLEQIAQTSGVNSLKPAGTGSPIKQKQT